MAKVMECPDCRSVMKCVHWYVDKEVGGEQGSGDFECRNCERVVNNERASVHRVEGYASAVFEGVPEDIDFQEFIQNH